MIGAAMMFWRENIILANALHASAGFGLALILQSYFRGQPFLPVMVGWLLLGLAAILHIYAFSG